MSDHDYATWGEQCLVLEAGSVLGKQNFINEVVTFSYCSSRCFIGKCTVSFFLCRFHACEQTKKHEARQLESFWPTSLQAAALLNTWARLSVQKAKKRLLLILYKQYANIYVYIIFRIIMNNNSCHSWLTPEMLERSIQASTYGWCWQRTTGHREEQPAYHSTAPQSVAGGPCCGFFPALLLWYRAYSSTYTLSACGSISMMRDGCRPLLLFRSSARLLCT